MDGIDGPDCRTLTKLFARRTESFYLGNRRPSCRRSRRRLCCAWRASGQPSQPSPSRWGSRCRSGQEPHQDLRLSQRSQHGDLQHLGHLLGLSALGRDRRDLHRETAVPVLVLLVLGRPQNFSRSPGFLSSSSQSRHGPREQNFHLEKQPSEQAWSVMAVLNSPLFLSLGGPLFLLLSLLSLWLVGSKSSFKSSFSLDASSLSDFFVFFFPVSSQPPRPPPSSSRSSIALVSSQLQSKRAVATSSSDLPEHSTVRVMLGFQNELLPVISMIWLILAFL